MPIPLTPPPHRQLLATTPTERLVEILAASDIAPGGRYRHWDTLRHLEPPGDISATEWWLGIKLARSQVLRDLPLVDPHGLAFRYCVPDEAMRLLHSIDKHAAGEVAMPEVVTGDEPARRTYLVNSLIEEAIRSSQLEGANTTRKVAKEMLRSGRSPRSRSERMIANNYRAMEHIREGIGDTLTPDAVLTLHRILTEGTLDNPDAAGRLQTPDEERIVVGTHEGEVVHRPPPADQLPDRLDAMCRFANGDLDAEGFVHPVLRAVLLHFWLAYDHPFEDGNGRTARALFYWCMRVQGYWLTEYLSISRIFRQAPIKYSNSFCYTESDERDTTYFVLYHLGVIQRAIDDLQGYLRRKVAEIREVERAILNADAYNYRQRALLSHALREPGTQYTFMSHARSHKVTHETARADLLDLQSRGLLARHRSGRRHLFTAVEDLAERLR